ncbi:MAG TPA: SAM-dependent methyltransferase [Natronosporangium sp.]
MDHRDWAPEDVDINRPSAARIYDYLLGGSHNFAVDREAAKQALTYMPDIAVHARANRAFLYRAVRYLVDAGVRQFLDIGSGVPTVGNVHEVAQRIDPTARVVYVDIDPVAVAHSRAILAGNDRATVIQEDLRRPDAILDHPDLRAMLDFDKPIALLLVAILHAMPNEVDPHQIVARLTSQFVPGSHLVISHGTADGLAVPAGFDSLTKRIEYPLTLRGHAEVCRFFEGFELVEPGVVYVPQWRPEDPDDVGEHPERSGQYAGVGRKP